MLIRGSLFAPQFRAYAAGRLAMAALCLLVASAAPARAQDPFRFRTGVDLINVSATVTDRSGRIVEGLSRTDFLVYEDDHLVEVTHFSAERVPVSLGIILDTSGSMAGDKITAARAALDRFLTDVIRPEDEVFLYRFDSSPHLVQGWTSDRKRITDALQALRPDGATALYDAVAQALPLLDSGKHFKKALLVISDGNDTNSRTTLETVRRSIRESDTLVYAIAIDTAAAAKTSGAASQARLQQRGRPRPFPFPMPGRTQPPRTPPIPGVTAALEPASAAHPRAGRAARSRGNRPPGAGQSRGAAPDHRRQRRLHRAGSRPSGSQPHDRPDRRRARQTVLSWVPEPRCQRRPLARHPGRGSRQHTAGASPARLSGVAVTARAASLATR